MSRLAKSIVLPLLIGCVPLSGCTARNVDFSDFAKPPRPEALNAYDVFVGKWDWKAEMENASAEYKDWRGTAEWKWTLDKRSLHGTMSASSGDMAFEAAGFWSWHPTRKKYIWWMFNDWGYPQEGTARYYKACEKCDGWWKMKYKSVGLDGTTSYGEHRLTVVDENTIQWSLTEWADVLHTIKKMAMTGTYTRRK